jgi:hypothetical protein
VGACLYLICVMNSPSCGYLSLPDLCDELPQLWVPVCPWYGEEGGHRPHGGPLQFVLLLVLLLHAVRLHLKKSYEKLIQRKQTESNSLGISTYNIKVVNPISVAPILQFFCASSLPGHSLISVLGLNWYNKSFRLKSN